MVWWGELGGVISGGEPGSPVCGLGKFLGAGDPSELTLQQGWELQPQKGAEWSHIGSVCEVMEHRQTSLRRSHACMQQALTYADSAFPALWGHLPDHTPWPRLLRVCVPPTLSPWKADIAWGTLCSDNNSNIYALYCCCYLVSNCDE